MEEIQDVRNRRPESLDLPPLQVRHQAVQPVLGGRPEHALQVKEGDKVVNYFLDDKGNGESYHEDVCGGEKVEGVSVTGTVSEKDGKKYIKPTKVEKQK